MKKKLIRCLSLSLALGLSNSFAISPISASEKITKDVHNNKDDPRAKKRNEKIESIKKEEERRKNKQKTIVKYTAGVAVAGGLVLLGKFLKGKYDKYLLENKCVSLKIEDLQKDVDNIKKLNDDKSLSNKLSNELVEKKEKLAKLYGLDISTQEKKERSFSWIDTLLNQISHTIPEEVAVGYSKINDSHKKLEIGYIMAQFLVHVHKKNFEQAVRTLDYLRDVVCPREAMKRAELTKQINDIVTFVSLVSKCLQGVTEINLFGDKKNNNDEFYKYFSDYVDSLIPSNNTELHKQLKNLIKVSLEKGNVDKDLLLKPIKEIHPAISEPILNKINKLM